MLYSKDTAVGINEVLCRCYKVLRAGEVIHLRSQSFTLLSALSGYFFKVFFPSLLSALLVGHAEVLFMKKKNPFFLHNDLEETQPSDLLSGALICKREMAYRVPLVKTVLSLCLASRTANSLTFQCY